MKHKKRLALKCPYCGGRAILRRTNYLFGDKTIGNEYVYVCQNYPNCDSYVTTVTNTMLPKGTLANKALRLKRIETHKIFDKVWKTGIMTKANAYCWIQDKFSLTKEQAHIGMFSERMCDELVKEAKMLLKNNRRIS